MSQPISPKPSLKALIVDDELPALEELSYMLEQSGLCSKIDTSIDVLEALKHLHRDRYDVIFVDIQMPGLNGLELVNVLRQFASPPKVVFVTAHDEYAVRAFELEASDYLLKPISKERLERALQRTIPRPGEVVETEDESLPKVRNESLPAEIKLLDKLPVDKEGKTILVDLADIRFAVARGDYVYIKTFEQEYLSRYSITDLEKRMPSPPFLRTHRAFLVNLRNVVEIYPFFNGAYVLKVNDKENSEVQVSRGQSKNLRSLLGM
jgi:two-component system LytT family response regulator